MDGGPTLLFSLLQLTDSAFPTGSFSHSLGLETFVQHVGQENLRKDPSKLIHGFICILENSGSSNIPFVKAAHDIVTAEKGLETQVSAVKSFKAKLTEMDKMLEACSTNHIAKRASTRQGRTFFEVCKLLYAASNESVFTTLSDLPFFHYPVVYGAVLAGLGLDLEVTLSSFIFGVSRTLVSTAVRLDVLGAMEGQKVQHILHQSIPAILKRNESKKVDETSIKFPVMDILQNSHDKLFSKLFYS